MTSDSNLIARRKTAALTSGGVSDARIYNVVLQVCRQIGVAGRMLDFGAGRGEFTRLLLGSGLCSAVTAVDISTPGSALPGATWIEADLNDRLSLEDQSFDAITAVEVVEHLENPRAVIRECSRLLRPGGYLVLSTPNNESWRAVLALVFRGHFVSFGESSYPAHITALLRLDIVRIMNEAALSVVHIGYSGLGAIPGMTRFTWQSLSGGLFHGRRFSDNIVIAAKKPALDTHRP